MLGSCGDFLTMFVWHNDEVRSEHPDIVVLASTDTCPNQIWRHRTLPVWGIQGHPELTRDQAVALVKQKRERLEKDGADVAELISAADEAAEAKVCFKVSSRRYCSPATMIIPGSPCLPNALN